MRDTTLCVVGLLFTLSSKVIWAEENPGLGTIEKMSKQSMITKLAKLRENLGPLNFKAPPPATQAEAAYFDFYGLNTRQHEHYFGTFSSGNYVLAAHVYRPKISHGTVVLMHGFLDHVGTLSSTIQHLLSQGFAVAAYDQPGHGLSSGPRASIDDFTDYASIFDDFLRIVDTHMPPPYHSVAHSTGAAVVADHLLTHKDGDLDQIILVAPLVRSAYWHLSTFFTPLADVFTDDVPRIFQDNSSDEQFLEFVRQDPLQPRQTSLIWFNALVDWNERIQSYPPNPRPLTIIQGNGDTIVDWEYNLEFLVTKFPNARTVIIDEGQHQLLNEGQILRAKVLQIVDDALATPLNPSPHATQNTAKHLKQ